MFNARSPEGLALGAPKPATNRSHNPIAKRPARVVLGLREPADPPAATPVVAPVVASTSLGIADVLDVLGYRDGEFVSVCHLRPGGPFSTSVMQPSAAPSYVAGLGDEVCVWFGVNPTVGPARSSAGRGTSEQTTRLAALFADLDVKPGACPDLATAEKVVDELSILLGQRPSAVVFTGHGLQPEWPIDDGDITDAFTVADAESLLRRFGRLAAVVAEHQGASVDTVFDLARVGRVPGTVNNKGEPVPTSGRLDVGGPLTVAEVDERLTEHGIDHQPEDTGSGEALSNPSDWVFAEQTCAYVATWLAGMPTDAPRPGVGRNPWACSQAVRLCCAWRLGCITEGDFRRAVAQLEARLAALLPTTEPRRALRRYEMRDILRLGRQRAACKTDEQARAELGGHGHHGGPEDFWGTGSAPSVNGQVATNGQAVAQDDGVETVDTARPSTSWEPFDLWPYLRGEIELPKPSIGIARSDGLRLLYGGREHAVIGETESGKTWFALQCVATELLAGNVVVYFHYEEGDPSSTVERLQLLGVPADVMAELLRFVAPARKLGDVGWMAALLSDPAPTLVVHDGVNEAMALHGLEIAGSGGAEGWSSFRRWLVSPATRVGAAVLSCDHVTKSRDGQGANAYGTVHKGNALDGARFMLENRDPFGRGMRGVSNVFVTKDRPGHLRSHGRPSKLAGKTFLGTLVADDEDSFTPFSLMLYAPRDDGGPPDAATSSTLADAVCDVIAKRPDCTIASSRDLFAAMRAAGHAAKDDAIRDAVADLVEAERVAKVNGARGAIGYRVVTTASRDEIS